MTDTTQDFAIACAAMALDISYTKCEWELKQHQAGFPGTLGTYRHAIAVAWKAAEAMRLHMEAQQAGNRRAYE